MKKALILFILVSLFGCRQENKSFETTPKASEQNPAFQLQEKDEIITGYIRAFNEIQDNLNQIKRKEKIIGWGTVNAEQLKSNKDWIVSDIQYIYDLLSKNKQALASMNIRFNKVTLKNDEIKKLNCNLGLQVEEKEKEIMILKDKLEVLKAELDLLSTNYTKEQKRSDADNSLLNRVYFAIGTLDGLKKEGLIKEKGGVIGIGKIPEINPNINDGMFSLLDMYETKEISVAAKELKIITLHPADSYKIENSDLRIKKLVILDPKQFWSVSKHLILLVSSDKPLPKKFDPEWNHVHL